MSRCRDQRGAALILIIGVVAALAIMASTLVMVTVNAAGNTKRDRYRAQAFNVAEGLLDYTLAQIGTNWPSTAPVTVDYTTFKSKYASAATQGGFTIQDTSVTFFDNQDTNGDNYFSRDDTYRYDYNKDGYIYVEAQATVNGQKARIQVEAKARTLDMQVPAGVAIATNADVNDPNYGAMSGRYAVGCDPAFGGYMGSATTYLSILAGGDEVEDPNTYDPSVFGPDLDGDGTPDGIQTGFVGPNGVQPANMMVTPAILQSIILSAKMTGKWYSDIPSEQAAGALAIPPKNDTAAWSGTVVVETLSKVDLENNDVMNGDGVGVNPKPGVLVIIGPHTMYPSDPTKVGIAQGLKIAGNGTYYGLIYTDGGIEFVGTMLAVGMIVAEQDVYLNGSRCVQYNANVIANLNQAVLVNAQVVPNTWRQIQPL